MGEHGAPPESYRQERPVARLDEIGSLIRQKRRTEHLSLEQAAEQAGVSAATIWRLERRATAAVGREMPTPDVRTLGAITDWLGVAVAGAGFVPVAPTETGPSPSTASVPDTVEAHLRADPKLDSATAALLSRMFRAAYSEFTADNPAGSDRSDRDGAVAAQGKEGE